MEVVINPRRMMRITGLLPQRVGGEHLVPVVEGSGIRLVDL